MAVIYICETCNRKFEDKPSAKRRFCSRSCKEKWQFSDPTLHPMWKGKAGNTSATHRWVSRVRIKPTKCDWCGAAERKARDGRSLLFWANLSGDYLRELDDWACLCMNCHWKFDNQIEKLIKYQKKVNLGE